MNTSNRTEITGKRDVRREIAARILTVDARIEAIRMKVRDKHPELLKDVDQARLQMLAQRRIAARDRSTLPALRAAGARNWPIAFCHRDRHVLEPVIGRTHVIYQGAAADVR